MGRVCTAIRSCALLELSPSEVLHTVSQLIGATPEASFVTCLYAVHDRADDTLTYANAGHLPAVLLAGDGTTEEIGEALAMPLGVGTEFPQEKCGFAPGMRLVLYTDGLIESHARDLTEGMEILLGKLSALAASADVEATCDELIRSLTGGRHDDVALLYVHYERRAGHDRAQARTGDGLPRPGRARVLLRAAGLSLRRPPCPGAPSRPSAVPGASARPPAPAAWPP